MTKPALVLIHGRSQAGRDPVELERIWFEALRQGLGHRADVLNGVEARFPFYGDALEDWVKRTGARTPGEARGPGEPDGIDPNFLAFQAEVATEILARHGIDAQREMSRREGDVAAPRSPEWVQGLFRLLDALPGATGAFISMVMRDVYLYLNVPGARRSVDQIVESALHGRCVVVAHSLGSVVAYQLLKAASSLDASLFMTVGSPLGIGPIRSAVTPRRFPQSVRRWVNAFDDRDDVALYPLGGGRFPVEPPRPIEDIDGVDNRTDNHHGIVEYLNKPAIAARIGEALGA